MKWPLPQDFNEAIQNPAVSFADPDLAGGETVEGPHGLPLPHSGNFADVYQVRGAEGQYWAVKCFTRPVFGLNVRYARLAEELDQANFRFTVGFTSWPRASAFAANGGRSSRWSGSRAGRSTSWSRTIRTTRRCCTRWPTGG